MTMRRLCFLFLVSVAAAFAAAALLTQAAPHRPPPPEVHVSFDLATDTHNDLYNRLRPVLRRLGNKVPYKPSEVMGRIVLGARRSTFYGEPPGWIMVDVVGAAPGVKTTLALADDDLYMLGFTNSSGHWFTVKTGSEGLPRGTVLPIRRSYGDLIDEGHKNLYLVPLGRQSAIEAASWLARYSGTAGIISKDQMRAGMVRFVMMICEATRFRAIRQVFADKWDQQTHIGTMQAEYVVHWGQLSKLLILWCESKYKDWGSACSSETGILANEIHVRNAIDALEIVDFLLCPN